MSPQDIASLQKDYQRLEQENRLLRARVDWLIKRYFGGQKSEQIDPKQLELLLAQLFDRPKDIPICSGVR